jgi:O-antigen ligase
MLNKFFYFTVLVLTLGQLASITKSGGLNIYIFDLAVFCFAFVSVLYFLLSKNLRVPKNLILYLLFALFGIFGLLRWIAILPTTDFLVSSFYLVRFIFYLLAGVGLYNMVIHKHIQDRSVLRAIVLSGVLISIFGLVQLTVLPDFETLDPLLGWDPHKNRLASTFLDPNFVGGYISICLSILLYSYFEKADLFGKNTLIIITIFLLFSLVLTFSRSSWLFFSTVVFTYGALKSPRLLFVGILIAFLAYFAVPRVQTRISGITDPTDSAHFRLISWGNTLDISRDHLLLGIGYNTFRYAQISYGFIEPGTSGGHSGAGSDSSLLLILATTGIIGLVIYLAAYLFPIMNSFLSGSGYRLLLLATFAGLLVQSQFINAVFYPQILFLTTTLLVLDN